MIELSNEFEQKIENFEKEKKELEQKIVIVKSEKDSMNNELSRLVYYKRSKKLEKYLEKHKESAESEESEESEFEGSEEKLDEEKKIYGASYEKI